MINSTELKKQDGCEYIKSIRLFLCFEKVLIGEVYKKNTFFVFNLLIAYIYMYH